MSSRIRSFNYLDLHDEEFEDLTFLLGHLAEPDLVKPEDPDLGLDGVVLAPDGGPAPHGFQAKHFTGSPSWAQCRKSLDAAVANYGVQHVTFTFPRDLTGGQIKKFTEELASRHPGVKVDYWGASQLTGRLLASAESERIARHIFGTDEYERMSRLIRAGRDLDTAGEAMSVLGATSDLFSDDPYFSYSMGSRPLSVPGAEPTEGTVMSVEVTDEHGAHHIDAHAKPAALAADRLPTGQMEIAGEDAIRRFREFLRVGGELELQGVRMTWEQMPKYIDELLTEDVQKGRVRLQAPHAIPPRSMRFELDTTSGQAAIDLEMQPTTPPEGWDHASAGQRGGTNIVLTMRRREDEAELNLTLSWRLDASRSAGEHLAGLRVIEVAAGTGEMRVIDSATGITIASGPSSQVAFDEDAMLLKQVFEDIVTLETWLGKTIEVPAQITGDEATAVHRVARLIEGVEATWYDMAFTLTEDPGEVQLSTGGLLQVRRKLWMNLFGQQYELGDEATYVSDLKVASSEAIDGGRKYALEANSDDAKVLIRLERSNTPANPELPNGP